MVKKSKSTVVYIYANLQAKEQKGRGVLFCKIPQFLDVHLYSNLTCQVFGN